jgi:hypothetical protein
MRLWQVARLFQRLCGWEVSEMRHLALVLCCAAGLAVAPAAAQTRVSVAVGFGVPRPLGWGVVVGGPFPYRPHYFRPYSYRPYFYRPYYYRPHYYYRRPLVVVPPAYYPAPRVVVVGRPRWFWPRYRVHRRAWD